MRDKRVFEFSHVVMRAANAFFGMFGLQGLIYQGVAGQKIEVPYEVTIFERGDAAAILLVDLENKAFLLLLNTRIGWALHNIRSLLVDCRVMRKDFRGNDLTLLSGKRFSLPSGQCQLVEIVAGTLDWKGDPASLVQSEVLEEAGYQKVSDVTPMGVFVSSPGASTEVVHLYYGYVTGKREPVQGSELEDGVLIQVPFKKALAMIASGEVIDGKTMVAIYHFTRLFPELF